MTKVDLILKIDLPENLNLCAMNDKINYEK
jgi:hypothetical protein